MLTHTVLTDNNPLTYIMTKPKLDACEQRWVSKLAPFDLDVKNIQGSQNILADLLSHGPFTKGFRITEPGNKANRMSLESVQNAFSSYASILKSNRMLRMSVETDKKWKSMR